MQAGINLNKQQDKKISVGHLLHYLIRIIIYTINFLFIFKLESSESVIKLLK